MRIFLSKEDIAKFKEENPKSSITAKIEEKINALNQDLQSAFNSLVVYKV